MQLISSTMAKSHFLPLSVGGLIVIAGMADFTHRANH